MRHKKYRPILILIIITVLVLTIVSIFILIRDKADYDNQDSQEWSLEWLVHGDKYLGSSLDRDSDLAFRHTYVPEIDWHVDKNSSMPLTFDGETFIANLDTSGSDPTNLYIFTYDDDDKKYILEDEISADDLPIDSRLDLGSVYDSDGVMLKEDVLALVNYSNAKAHILRRNNGKWSFEQKIEIPRGGSNLLSVSLSDSNTLSMGSPQGFYVFQYNNQGWVLENEFSFEALGENNIRDIGFNDNILAVATSSDIYIFRQKESRWIFEEKISPEFMQQPRYGPQKSMYVSQKSIVFSGTYPSNSVRVLNYTQDGWVTQEISDQYDDKHDSFGVSGGIAFLDDQTLAISDLIESIQIFKFNDDNRWVLSQVVSRDTSPRIENPEDSYVDVLIDKNNRLENLYLTSDGRLVVVDYGERKMYIFSKQ